MQCERVAVILRSPPAHQQMQMEKPCGRDLDKQMMKDNNSPVFSDSKPHYELLDGLRDRGGCEG